MCETILASLPSWVKTTVDVGYCVLATVFLISAVLMLINIYREPIDGDEDEDPT